jgi:membrane protein
MMENSLINYLSTGIWRIRSRDLPPLKGFFLRHLRILTLTARESVKDKCLLRATALTFYSLFSIGPVVALALGIATWFGLRQRFEANVLAKLPVQEEVLTQILTYAHSLLDDTRGGVIAGVSVAMLLWSAMKLLNHLEQSFNDIWQVEKSRSWKTRISNYLSFLILAPLFLLIYSSIPAFVTSQLDDLSAKLTFLAKVSPKIIDLLQLLPYLLIWTVFSLVYLLIPNTRVKPISGILAGVLAGTAYLVVQWALIDFQVGVTRYNPIYGSLAALPLLLLWMNVGWIVLLIGAEYAYAHQNVDLYELEPEYTGISPRFKKVLTLQILHRMVTRFSEGKEPLSAGQFSQQLEIPVLLVQHILNELVKTGLVSLTKADGSRDPAFQPSRDIHRWTIRYIIDALELHGVNRLPIAETETLKSIILAVEELTSEMKHSEANRLLMNL